MVHLIFNNRKFSRAKFMLAILFQRTTDFRKDARFAYFSALITTQDIGNQTIDNKKFDEEIL